MDINWLLDRVAKEWSVITAAPTSFMLCVLLGWVAVYLIFRRRLTDARESLDISKDQRALLQSKLEDAAASSPPQKQDLRGPADWMARLARQDQAEIESLVYLCGDAPLVGVSVQLPW